MKAATPKLLFSQQAIPLILEAFGKSINDDGLIIETATREPVLTPDGEEMKAADFGGIKRGSEIFIKDDLFSIINLAEGKY
jgi:hypothetical protein